MTFPSLTKSVRTCKVSTGDANRTESDRFLNPRNMVCPMPSGYDLLGRKVCPYSFDSKTAGCNSAMDRVTVENNLRPRYSEFITLDVAQGVGGDLYNNDARQAKRWHDNRYEMVGTFGADLNATNIPSCPTGCEVNNNRPVKSYNNKPRQHRCNCPNCNR